MLHVQRPRPFSLKNDSVPSTHLGCCKQQNRIKKQEFVACMRMIVIQTTVYPLVFLMMTYSTETLGQNYDEQKVPAYKLPDPLIAEHGKGITSAEAWQNQRRQEIIDRCEQEVYGKTPTRRLVPQYFVTEDWTPALDGKAVRKQLTIQFDENGSSATINVVLYRPANKKDASPIFVGLNFLGNQSIHADREIHLCENWTIGGKEEGIAEHQATAASRGIKASRWPLEEIIARGYAVATAHCGDLDPDFDDGFKNGIHPLFADSHQEAQEKDAWGTIGAWSWGLSRILDYFERDPTIDQTRAAVIGHSRLGKTALWAGAKDPRFAAVISNNSGCGGAALSRRQFGETVEAINTSFPHWFCGNFKKYNRHEENLPVDQHMLVALIAPRPVYVASATEDLWADPRGEFLSLLHADPVYKLLGTDGLSTESMPAPDQPVQGIMGYHLRTGPHDITLYDWQQYLDFADRHLQSK